MYCEPTLTPHHGQRTLALALTRSFAVRWRGIVGSPRGAAQGDCGHLLAISSSDQTSYPKLSQFAGGAMDTYCCRNSRNVADYAADDDILVAAVQRFCGIVSAAYIKRPVIVLQIVKPAV